MRKSQQHYWHAGWLLSLVIVALLVAACQPASAPTSAAQVPVTAATATTAPTMVATTEATKAAAVAPAVVKLMVKDDAKLGKFLVDDKGMTLYLFTKDSPGKSVCEGKCLAAWPALLVAKDGKITVEGGDDKLISTITRSDGSTQVAYNNYPLYYYAPDKKPGDVTGQGVGNVWYVIGPDGKGIGMTPPASSGGDDTGYGKGSGTGSAQAPAEVKLMVKDDAKLGKFLVDEKGMALYLFTKDAPGGKSVCEDKCLAAWPALMVAKDGKITVEGGDDKLVSTITRSDGSTQVAYNNWPLYYYVKDTKPGDVTGQGVGSVWYVISPEGKEIDTDEDAGSGSAAAPAEVKLMVKDDAALGKFLVDEKGMTLYLYTKDTPGKSVCEGQCLANWPALLVAKDGKVTVDGGDASLVSIITRPDGSSQVAYRGLPLYYWVKDKAPGDTTGQGVGGVWYVVKP